MPEPQTIRRQVFFSGRVQGVGFRYTTVSLARRFEVTGFVRNLADGRVELVAEGPPTEIDAFVGAIHDEMTGHISHVEARESAATSEFAAFGIAR